MKNSYIDNCKIQLKLIFIIISISISFTNQWKPEDLLRNQFIKDIIDSNEYLNYESVEFQQIKNIIYNIKNKHNLDLKIVIFNRMNYEYRGNIELFTDELAYKSASENREKDYDSLIIAFAIEDRKMRIRIGKNIKNKLSDFAAKSLLEDLTLKSYLRSMEYTKALKFLLEKLNNKLTNNEASTDYGNYFVLAILSLGFIYYIINSIYSSCFRKKKYTINEKLEKIKQLTESRKNKKQFIADNCIICLEEFSNKDSKMNNKQIEGEKSSNKILENDKINENIIKEDNTNFKKDNLEKTESKINTKLNKSAAEENDDSLPFSLECGHTFHKKCISSWLSKKNSCPLCKAKIDIEEDDTNYKSIQENLVEIQTEYHPELRQWDLNFSNETFSWRNPREVAHSGNAESYHNNNDNDYANESAGASSEW